MNIESLAKFFKDVRSIWVGILAMCAATVWAADTVFVSHSELDKNNIEQIRREIAEAEVRKGFSSNEKEKRMYETLIKVKENQIKSIKGE